MAGHSIHPRTLLSLTLLLSFARATTPAKRKEREREGDEVDEIQLSIQGSP